MISLNLTFLKYFPIVYNLLVEITSLLITINYKHYFFFYNYPINTTHEYIQIIGNQS